MFKSVYGFSPYFVMYIVQASEAHMDPFLALALLVRG
jgi:hypothetical protein